MELEAFGLEPFRLIDEAGMALDSRAAAFGDDELRELHGQMLRAREVDRKLVTLLRQGRTTFYSQSVGMEATQIGLAKAMRPGHDWLWPYYRDQGIVLTLGLPLAELMAQSMGANADPCKGRQMPHHFGSAALKIVPVCSSLASQIPPATGSAMAQRLLGTDEITVCTFGEGSTSEGDWHAGVNMAGVMQAPVLFVCENNQWAISTPMSAQTASDGIAVKGRAYGIPGYLIDGNDVLAVLYAARQLVAEMRAGGGPVLLECLTYRIGSHSNADADAEKSYRTREEVAAWTARDPLGRFERYLEQRGLGVGAEERVRLIAAIHREVDEAIRLAEASGVPDWRGMFEDVYVDLPVHLRQQYAEMNTEAQGVQG
jgi:2-oxoisovalerate dehydrogenase E1 component alpha subunit